MLEKTFESPLDCKEIKPVNPKGNQFWIFIGRTNAEAEIPILWPPDVELTYWKRPWLIWKYPDAGKDWRQEEKWMTEDEMVGWRDWLSGYEFEQAPGVGDGRRSLACCSPWGRKESDTTGPLNWYLDSGVLCVCAQSCLTPCYPIDCSLSGFSVHGIFQARTLEWVTISYSRGSSQPKDRFSVSCISCVSCIGSRFFTTEPPRKPH